MKKSNKKAREELEKIYGKKCMIEQLGIKIDITGYNKNRHKYSGKSIQNQLTYHHLVPKRLGGKATVNNGAISCRVCHDWLEQLPEEEREKINKMLIEYKKEFLEIHAACLTSEGVISVESLPLDFDFTDIQIIPLEQDNSKYNRARALKEEKRRKEKRMERDEKYGR